MKSGKIVPEQTRGVRNRNPGNIRLPVGQWQGATGPQLDKEFITFDDPKFGIRAICRVLITYQDKRHAGDGSKIDTIREIIERWAPALENDVGAYATHVSSMLDIGADEAVDVHQWDTMRSLVVAIIAHECAGYAYPNVIVSAGLSAAGLQRPRSQEPIRIENVATVAVPVVSAITAATQVSTTAAGAVHEVAAAIGAGPLLSYLIAVLMALGACYLGWRLIYRRTQANGAGEAEGG